MIQTCVQDALFNLVDSEEHAESVGVLCSSSPSPPACLMSQISANVHGGHRPCIEAALCNP